VVQDPEHILIVDDDPDMVAIAQLALSDIGGLATSTATNTEAALVARAASGAELVLMDLRLDRENGVDAWRALLAQAKGALHVIFVTGARSDEVVDLVDEAGYLGVIAKPFDPIGLANEVRALWAARP
jgi:DNA-binding response OmpR family regulator